MNKSKLKSYAPAARREFIQAVTDRANAVGLFSDKNILPLEVMGDVTIIGGKSFPLRVADQREKLEQRIARHGFDQTMEAMAYTWFNRFVALRYMELHDYLDHGYRVLSNRNGSHIPEILEYATEVNLAGLNHELVVELKLDGNRDAELYRMLVVAQCNALHSAMPFLFERIGGATELLLPDNLLHSDALIRKLIIEINEEDWLEVEIIGWLYQFYISEKKDQVIGKVVKSEDIPAATQLFTPNWIVKYMVQNTLGRQWLATYPNSPIRGKIEYYIEPAEQTDEIKTQLAAITPKELDPESITLLDPACGSGHILVEAYDLFMEMYLERGYRTRDIPMLILEKNLHGIEIDDRAAQLAGFALLMKARADDKHILDSDNPVQLNILAIQESKELNIDEIASVLLQERIIKLGATKQQQEYLFQQRARQLPLGGTEKPDVSREQLSSLLGLFKEGKTAGSLLIVPDKLKETLPKFKTLLEKAAQSDAQSMYVAAMLLPLVRQAELLSNKYTCVITNPPYMGGKGMNQRLKVFAQDHYPNSKSDLFAMFIERGIGLIQSGVGLSVQVTMHSWMFLGSFEAFRRNVIFKNAILFAGHLGSKAFSEITGPTVQVVFFGLAKSYLPRYKPVFLKADSGNEEAKKAMLKDAKNRYNKYSNEDFESFLGARIAYWISNNARKTFDAANYLKTVLNPRQGMATTNNDKFLRCFWEVSYEKICRDAKDRNQAVNSKKRWFPYNKGGTPIRWYGNQEYIINFENDGDEICRYIDSNPDARVGSNGRVINRFYYFKDGITWGDITFKNTRGEESFAARYTPHGFIFDIKGSSGFPEIKHLYAVLCLLNSKVVRGYMSFLNPTMTFQVGDISEIPYSIANPAVEKLNVLGERAVDLAKTDWDTQEISYDFSFTDSLRSCRSILESFRLAADSYIYRLMEAIRVETEINKILLECYGLTGELSPTISEEEIYMKRIDPHLYACDLISYAIGCMMGRYSLDQHGLVYAHSGNIDFDLTKYQTFPVDPDGIIPINDMEWFPDEVANRIVEFIRVTWPPATLNENLKFMADSLSSKGNETSQDTIRRYLSTSFFKDHLQTYKRRPIYWLFASGKERAFQCLVYLHRYNEGTLSRMRNEYVTPLFGKMNARVDFLKHDIEAASSASLRNKLQKQLDSLKKKLAELTAFDDELRHYADKHIKLDLDDGVKVNYGKFGKLLADMKAVTGE